MAKRWTSVLLVGLISASCAWAEDDGNGEEKPTPKLPGLTIDREAGVVDVDGKIAATDAYLELIACTEGSKEHEALVSLKAKAKHVHLALMLLGAKPGQPSNWVYDKEKQEWVGVNPKGTEINVTLLLKEEDKWVEKPLSTYVVDGEKNPLPAGKFIFGGSKFRKTDEGDAIYEADASGNAISLVSFGDEMLSWPTAASHSNEALEWYTKTDSVPKMDTKIKLRLRPKVAKPESDSESDSADADEGEEQTDAADGE